MQYPFISRVKIKNYRNFEYVDVELKEKQVIIGENNVGKTNFLRAIQLILDPQLNDQDRYLEETDFFKNIESPMINGVIIEVMIEIKHIAHNKNLLCQLSDATISTMPDTIRLTYRYFPRIKEDGTVEGYNYKIFKGNNEENEFTHTDRKYLNIRVIKPVRDVEAEIKNARKSPLNSLLKGYNIEKKALEAIAVSMKTQNDQVLTLGELQDLERRLNKRFKRFVDVSPDSINLGTNELNANKILYALKLLLGGRSAGDTSLGLTNILYITLILLSIEDRTIPTFLKNEAFSKLQAFDKENVLTQSYISDKLGNKVLKSHLSPSMEKALYSFMDLNNPIDEGATILAIEEPEAHLHPAIQRSIYKDVFSNSSISVLMTTHSTHIASISPLGSILHLYRNGKGKTTACSSATAKFTDAEYNDLARYIDVKRGEIYFGKGVLLVEGITEEYLIPEFAGHLGKSLDYKGIVLCNINSTNFTPYIKLLRSLGIPFAVITDGDYYEIIDEKRKYHIPISSSKEYGYLGIELIEKLIVDLGILKQPAIPNNIIDKDKLFRELGFFIGRYTAEIEIMEECHEDIESSEIICKVFNDLTSGGESQKGNFKMNLADSEFWKCLNQIESPHSRIGKGRFAQRLANHCTEGHIPEYIREALEYIDKKVDEIEDEELRKETTTD
jgi:putative ATP-dependent endonuclease of OLD family